MHYPGCKVSNISVKCKEEVKIKATVEATHVQRRGDAVWLTALASRTKGVKRMMDDNALLRVQTITPKKLYQAQREYRAIGEEIEYTRKRQTTNTTRQAEGTARPSIPLAYIQETTHWRKWNPPSHQLNIYPDALKL